MLYVIYDTQCPYCQRMYEASRDVLEDVTIRWVPVGFLGEQSLHEAAQIVDAENPAEAMATIKQGGSISGASSTEAMDIVSQNSQLTQQAGIGATPVVVSTTTST